MQISKPVVIGIVVVALVALAAALWFTVGGGANQASVPDSAYPKSGGGPGVEAAGTEPAYTGSGPTSTLPLEGQASGGGGR